MRKIPTTFALMGACGLVFPSGFVQAEHESSLQVQTKEKAFTIGHLTLPSQKEPGKIVQDALQDKTKQALSLQQVNGESGVAYSIVQQRKAYDGTTLVRLQQTFQGKDVYGHQLTAHVDQKGVITSISGNSAQQLGQQNTLKKEMHLSTEDAKAYIYETYGKNISFFSEPVVKPVIYMNEKSGEAIQAYQVTFAVATPQYVSGTYIVDAEQGSMLQNMIEETPIKVSEAIVQKVKEPLSKQKLTSLQGYGKDDLGIFRTFGISQKSDGTYLLADYTRGKGIETYDAKYTDLATDFQTYPGNLASHTASIFQDAKAVSAHYLATKVYDFYKEKYQRNSFDNKGQKVTSIVHAWDSMETSDPKNWHNAASIGEGMLVYGDPMVKAYDVAGHEFTHAITSNESRLEYYGESGAINEAISDIFGTAIEKYVNNGTFNWEIGEQTGTTLRSMQDPTAVASPYGIPYPDDYRKFNNLNGEDKAGVHFNSSIINKVAYLIAAGGTHNGVQINGIGENKMFDIFYYANTDELNATSDFAELRVACIRVATQKYGKQSQEVQAVTRAFDAVHISAQKENPQEKGSNQDQEPNQTLEEASILTFPARIKGSLLGDDSLDVYKFTVAEPRNLHIAVQNENKIGMTWVLHHESDLQQYVAYGKEQGDSIIESYQAKPGTYYLYVYKYTNQNGAYQLSVD
ncbi:TPA: M4 family metallopeptidase [Bacillus cereus]|nr:M4 family metallopeptidase [Bacillus cereus]